MYYRDWEEAAKKSKWQKAVAKIHIVHKNRMIKAEIIKPLYKDPVVVYYHSGVIIRHATSQEMDRITRWKPW